MFAVVAIEQTGLPHVDLSYGLSSLVPFVVPLFGLPTLYYKIL